MQSQLGWLWIAAYWLTYFPDNPRKQIEKVTFQSGTDSEELNDEYKQAFGN